MLRGRRLTIGAVAHARRSHYSLSLFPVPLRLYTLDYLLSELYALWMDVVSYMDTFGLGEPYLGEPLSQRSSFLDPRV